MDNQLFIGERVRLAAQDPERFVEPITKWNEDTWYTRMLNIEPVKPPAKRDIKDRLERPRNDKYYPFGVKTLADDTLIGFVILMDVNYVHNNAFVGIGIGEPEYRGKGYGTETMNLALRYAFQELNMHRVSLDTLGSNLQAIRSYEKAGFVHEGRQRGNERRNGTRDDLVCMGILRSEWEQSREW